MFHSSGTPSWRHSREAFFCCRARARAARSRGEGDRGRHRVPGISTARPLWRGTGLGGGAARELPTDHATTVRALVRAARWSRAETSGDVNRCPSASARRHGDGWRLAQTCGYAHSPTYKAGVAGSSPAPPTNIFSRRDAPPSRSGPRCQLPVLFRLCSEKYPRPASKTP